MSMSAEKAPAAECVEAPKDSTGNAEVKNPITVNPITAQKASQDARTQDLETKFGDLKFKAKDSVFSLSTMVDNEPLMPIDFGTYDALKDHTVRLITSVGLCESLKSQHNEAYVFLRNLLGRHPDAERKKVALMTDMRIRRFPRAPLNRPLQVADYQLFIVCDGNEDGDGNERTEDSISWAKAILREDYSVETKLVTAMRHAIEVCRHCGTTKSLTHPEDNTYLFERLMYAFLRLHPMKRLETFSKDPLTAQDCFTSNAEDAAFDTQWRDYWYNKTAHLILCTDCKR
jgi:hypothetical protein